MPTEFTCWSADASPNRDGTPSCSIRKVSTTPCGANRLASARPCWRRGSVRDDLSGSMNIPIFQVDEFTDKMFSGNPAAACLLVEWRTENQMTAIGVEQHRP